jgi:hypothetical protein
MVTVVDGLTFTAVNCIRSTGHDTVSCEVSPGVGANFRWQVSVEGQSSNPSTILTSYPPPSLTTISGIGASDEDTQGGQSVTLSGVDFGPAVANPSWPVVATYGMVGDVSVLLRTMWSLMLCALQSGVEYVATSCVVVLATPLSSQATCMTTQGIGRNLQWRVCVADQCSGLAGNTSYGRPIISQFAGVGAGLANTEGNEVLPAALFA